MPPEEAHPLETPEGAAQEPARASTPSLPTLAETKHYLRGFDFFERYVQGQWEGDLYVETHARRFLETLRLLPALRPAARVLELGAVPYYMTVLVKRFLGLEVDPISFFEVEEEAQAVHTVSNRERGEEYSFEYRALNVERDVFPCVEDTYELVLCCEILEHLLINPSHMLYEIHRALRPGAYLMLTTPNALRWGNLWALLKGRNIYDRYLGNGIYGRHNREYSPREVVQLLEAVGFEIERVETRNVYGSEWLNSIPFFSGRRDNIFVVARRGPHRARMAYPEELYALMDEYKNVVRSALRMGETDVGHLGRGWYEFEPGEPGFRWTKERAQIFLKNNGARRLHVEALSHHPRIARGEPVELLLRVNGRALEAVQLRDQLWHDYSFELEATEADVLSCEIEVSHAFVPKEETGAGDERQLGVCVRRVWLEEVMSAE